MKKQLLLPILSGVLFVVIMFAALSFSAVGSIQSPYISPIPQEQQLQKDNSQLTFSDPLAERFDVRWLLPLLTIPVVVILLKQLAKEDTQMRYGSNPLFGMKGGKSSWKKNVDNEAV